VFELYGILSGKLVIWMLFCITHLWESISLSMKEMNLDIAHLLPTSLPVIRKPGTHNLFAGVSVWQVFKHTRPNCLHPNKPSHVLGKRLEIAAITSHTRYRESGSYRVVSKYFDRPCDGEASFLVGVIHKCVPWIGARWLINLPKIQTILVLCNKM